MHDPFTRFGELMARIAVTPNVVRARHEDAHLSEMNGGDFAALMHRVELAAERLEQVATRLTEEVR